MTSSTDSPHAQQDSFDKEEEKKEQKFSTSENSKEIPSNAPAEEFPNEEGGTWVTGLPLFTILGAICLVCFLMLLDTSIIVTAIPEITTQFHSLQDVGWYGSAYQLSRCVPCQGLECMFTEYFISAALLPLTGNLYVNFDSKVSRYISIVKQSAYDVDLSCIVDFPILLRCLRIGLPALRRGYILENVDCWASSGRNGDFRYPEWCFHYHRGMRPHGKETRYI